MIRTNVVELTVIPAIAYRQKLPSGDVGITILSYGVAQPGLATISKTSGDAILSANTPKGLYPTEAFQEAITLTNGMPYRRQKSVQVKEEIVLEAEEELPQEPEELEDVSFVVDSPEYQRLVDRYTDKNGRLSYDLLNRELIQAAHASGQVRLMIEEKATADEIRVQVVKAQLRNLTRKPSLTDAQVAKMIELLDETSPKGVLRPLNDEIRKWLRAGK